MRCYSRESHFERDILCIFSRECLTDGQGYLHPWQYTISRKMCRSFGRFIAVGGGIDHIGVSERNVVGFEIEFFERDVSRGN